MPWIKSLLFILLLLFLVLSQFSNIRTSTTINVDLIASEAIAVEVVPPSQPPPSSPSSTPVELERHETSTTSSTNRCQSFGLLTVGDGGRLGNLMSQYATLVGASEIINATPVISDHMQKTLAKVFPYLSIPVLNCTGPLNWKIVNIEQFHTLNTSNISRAQNTFIGGFPNELPIYHSYHQSLSQNEFKMDLGLVASAKLFLRKVARDTGASVFVGMHVRRTDYAVWLKAKVNGRLLSKRYFMEAKAYLQRKFLHSKLVFIVASDDRKWCQEMFAKEEDMMMTHLANRAGLDLAILSQCNHSIISFGTFSFWSAFLKNNKAGGEVIVADGFALKSYRILPQIKSILPEWKIIADPCFSNSSSLHTSIPRLTPECRDKKIEYGIYDDH